MESQLCSSWTLVLMISFLLRNISLNVSSPTEYHLHLIPTSFDEAMKSCSPGSLATLTTDEELGQILKFIQDTIPVQERFTFWVGLKLHNECVLASRPLRGFRWTENGSQESAVIRWVEEPTLTCTSIRCAALTGRSGEAVTTWGLISSRCSEKNWFICKVKDGKSRWTPENPETTTTSEPRPQPTTPEHEPVTQDPLRQATPKTRPPSSEQDLPTARPEPDFRPALDPDHRPPTMSSLCRNPNIPGKRAISLDPNHHGKIRVECWSNIYVDLVCSGHPISWQTVDGSLANLSAVCLPCADGYHKDASARCVDVDECRTSNPCRHNCLNTAGSYRCVCANGHGNHTDEACEGSDSLFTTLIPVLVTVAVFVVLLVIVVVTVKCCLIKQSKKQREEEKMETNNKNGKDLCETAA
ncbi:C-type lectin domain family 14 member A [Pholidichthys leucotaenia]